MSTSRVHARDSEPQSSQKRRRTTPPVVVVAPDAPESKEEKREPEDTKKAAKKDRAVPLRCVEHTPERFDWSDTRQMELAMGALERDGYVVFSGAATPTDISRMTGKFWDYMEALSPGVERKDASTWTNARWPGIMSVAILKYYGIGNSNIMWDARTLPAIRAIYERAYSSPASTSSSSSSSASSSSTPVDLVVSFDGLSVRRGAEHVVKSDMNEVSKSGEQVSCSWPHVDRSLLNTPDMNGSFQGSLNLFDVAPSETGAFLCVPGSHHTYSKQVAKKDSRTMAWMRAGKGHYLTMTKSHPIIESHTTGGKLDCIAVACKAGDFVVWNSALTHANVPPSKKIKGRLLRLTAFVSMIPRIRSQEGKLRAGAPASKKKLPKSQTILSEKEYMEARYKAAAQAFTGEHSPHNPLANNHLIYPRKGSALVTPAECFRSTFTDAERALL